MFLLTVSNVLNYLVWLLTHGTLSYSSVNAPLDKDLGTDTKRLSKEIFILQKVNSEEVKKTRDQL